MRCFEWSPQSQHLNPAKIMRDFGVTVINVRRHNLKDLEQALVNEWSQILVK